MKAALITGAARRIGAAIAKRLAGEGWQVVLHYKSSSAPVANLRQDIEQAGGIASIVPADLSDASATEQLIEAAFKDAPGLEMVVNNASMFEYDDLATLTATSLNDNFAVNTVAPVLIARAFANKLDANREGLVINLLDNRIWAPNPDYVSYAISKHGLEGATRILALSLAPHVRVNAIAPGITLPSGKQSEENFQQTHRLNPLGRGCTPDDIARAVSFIHDTQAMTGAIITIDGGQSLVNPGRDVAFL